MPTPSSHGCGAEIETNTPTIDRADAPIIAVRSPMRATRAPAGMSPTSSPTRIIAAMRPAPARPAPRLSATTGMIGMIAPSPIENSSVGRKTETTTDRQGKVGWAVLIASHATPQLGWTSP